MKEEYVGSEFDPEEIIKGIEINNKWHGITYFSINGWFPEWFYNLWKKLCCPRGWHLLDECLGACACHRFDEDCPHSVGNLRGYQHTLICDACNLEIILKD